MYRDEEGLNGFRVDDLVEIKSAAFVRRVICVLDLYVGWSGEVVGFQGDHVQVRLTGGAPDRKGDRQPQSGVIGFLPQFLRVTGHKSLKVIP